MKRQNMQAILSHVHYTAYILSSYAMNVKKNCTKKVFVFHCFMQVEQIPVEIIVLFVLCTLTIPTLCVRINNTADVSDLFDASSAEEVTISRKTCGCSNAGVVELADTLDLGAVTSVKVFGRWECYGK